MLLFIAFAKHITLNKLLTEVRALGWEHESLANLNAYRIA